MSKKFPFYGSTLEYSDEMIKHNDLRSNFIYLITDNLEKSESEINKAISLYKEIGNFSDLIDDIIAILEKYSKDAISFSVFTLMQYKIDTYDKKRFGSLLQESNREMFFENIGFTDAIEMIGSLIDNVFAITKGVENQRIDERSGRGSYVNLVSSNLSSAVAGEIRAGILNAGLSVTRGIMDSVVDSNDKRRIKQYIEKQISDSEFINTLKCAVHNVYYSCFMEVASILWENKKLICPFPTVSNEEETMSRISNYVEFGDKYVAKELIMKQLQINPYTLELYIMMYRLFGDNNFELFRLTDYFDMNIDYTFALMDNFVHDDASSSNIEEYINLGLKIDEQVKNLEQELADYKKANLA